MNPKKYPRLGGFVLALIGLGTSAWVWSRSVQAAEQGQPRVQLHSLFAVLVAVGFLGLVMSLLGGKVQRYSQGLREREKTLSDYLIIGAIVAPGLIAYFVLKMKIESLGYKF